MDKSGIITTEDTGRSTSCTLAVRALCVFDSVVDAGAAAAAALLIVVMLATTVKVVFRYLLHQSLIGVDQISGTLLLYVVFLGSAWVLRRDEHVVVDLLLGNVKRRTRWLLMLMSSLIGAVVCLVVAVFGVTEVINSIERGIRIPGEIEMPRSVDLIVIPIGFLLMGLQFLRRAVASLMVGDDDKPSPPPVSSN